MNMTMGMKVCRVECPFRKECEDSLSDMALIFQFVGITFCKVQHRDSVTKPDYYYYYYYSSNEQL